MTDTFDLNPVPAGPPFVYKPHPLAAVFPMIDGQEFRDLIADVRANGVLEPVDVLDEMILDGRNRYMAAREAGVSCPARLYSGDDPVAYVISRNLRRRNLSSSQCAMAASKLATMPRGRPGKSADLPISQPEAAAMIGGTSERLVRDAAVVRKFGDEGLVDMAERGEVAVTAAAEVARLPADEQAAVIGKGAAAVTEKAAEVRTARAAERWQDRVAKLVERARLGGPVEPNKPDIRVAIAVHLAITGKRSETVAAILTATDLSEGGLALAVHHLVTDPDVLDIERQDAALILSSIMAADVQASSGYRLDEARSDAEALERVWRKGWVWAVLNRPDDAIDFQDDDSAEAFCAGHAAFLAELAAFVAGVG